MSEMSPELEPDYQSLLVNPVYTVLRDAHPEGVHIARTVIFDGEVMDFKVMRQTHEAARALADAKPEEV